MPKMLKDWLSRDHQAPWPVWDTSYLQSELINSRTNGDDPGGVCFRLAFKWLACQRSGQQFTYVQQTDNQLHGARADRTISKQNVYLKAVAPFERAPNAPKTKGEYKNFLTQVDRESVNILNVWGQAPKYRLKFSTTTYTVLVGSAALDGDCSVLIGVYGKSDGGPWAHATAFHRKGGKALYFDSNGGEFEIGTLEDAAALIQSDLQRYEGDTANYMIKHYAAYKVV